MEEIQDVKEPEPIPEPEPAVAESLINKANEAADRIEQSVKDYQKMVERQEAIAVEQKLGGQADTQVRPQKTADEIARDNARKFLEGTGYEDELFPNE